MSISNYGELKTAVQNWLHRSDSATASRAPEWIELALTKINLELRIRAMEATSDITIDSQTESLPTRFLGVRRFYISADPNRTLEYLAPDAFWRLYLSTQTNTPKAFTIEGENLVFGPTPDSTYAGKLLYWQGFASFSDDSDTNWLLSNAPGLLLYGALLEASAYFSRPVADAMQWALRYDSLIEDIKESDNRDRFPSGGLAMRTIGVTTA